MQIRKPRKRRVTHVRMGDDGAFKTFFCERCGNVMRYVLPMPIDVWVVMANQYVKKHRHCKPRQRAPHMANPHS